MNHENGSRLKVPANYNDLASIRKKPDRPGLSDIESGFKNYPAERRVQTVWLRCSCRNRCVKAEMDSGEKRGVTGVEVAIVGGVVERP